MPTNRLIQAHMIALILPLALMAGALGSQFIGGLYPCEMCHWQRWPHYAAIAIAALAFFVPQRGPRIALVALAGLAVAISGVIGVLHAGVEYHWWAGFTACSNSLGSGSIEDIMKAPIIACDRPQWTLFGISLAGFNAIISLTGAALIFWLLLTRNRPA